MKAILFGLFLCYSAITFAGESLRNLKVHPLTVNEFKALSAAVDFAKSLDEKISFECVNASFVPGVEPVSVQFLRLGEEGPECVDPHYSLEVHFTPQGKITTIKIIDA
jgi:hypothetical protein